MKLPIKPGILAAALIFSGTAMAQTAPAAPEPAPPAAPAPVPEQPVTTVTTVTTPSGSPVGTVIDVASPGNYTPPPSADPPASYPPCSRTITDHCRQRGGR